MLPQTYDIPDGYDKKATLEWIDSLITPENLTQVLNNYDFQSYESKRVEDDTDMPNYHIFTFIPKSNKLFYPIKLGIIFTELFQKTLVTEPLDEDQIWEFDQKSFDLKIILKATD